MKFEAVGDLLHRKISISVEEIIEVGYHTGWHWTCLLCPDTCHVGEISAIRSHLIRDHDVDWGTE